MLDIAGSRPFRQFRRVLTPEATVVVIGAPMTGKGLGPLKHIAATRAGCDRPQPDREVLHGQDRARRRRAPGRAHGRRQIKPVINRRYPLREAADALRYLGERHARGKIVLTV
jgi:NADPH:quinone reductase-like Zn-dependent oxidoreductase